MNRRECIASVGAATLAATLGSNARAADAAPGTPAELNALFDAFVKEGLDLDPEGATSLGLDVGDRAPQKAKLDDRSPAGAETRNRLNADQLARLEAFNASALPPADALNRDVVLYSLRQEVQAAKTFKYAGGAAGNPYLLNQFQGSAYHDLPDFLDSQHQIATKADAEAYLARLAAFPVAMDQEAQSVRLDQSVGVVPPDFVLDKTLVQLEALRAAPADKSVLVASLVRRTKEKGIEGDWSGRATKIYLDDIVPALDRQIALVKSLRAVASHDAGVWRLPDGDAYYVASVAFWTTTTLSGDEIHRTGLDLVATLSAKVDEAMKAQGLTQGTVGERFRAMYDDPKYRYPNTDDGKAKLLADLNTKVTTVQARLPAYFGVLPKAKVEIRRIPPYTEAGAPGGYYQPARRSTARGRAPTTSTCATRPRSPAGPCRR